MSDIISSSKINEFDQYRFARNEVGGLAELPSLVEGERVFLVLDCRRYRLARLHIFEGGTAHEEAEWFGREMQAIRRLQHRSINRIYRWGRDDTEFFFTDALIDGERMDAYLERAGAMSPVWAARITLELIEVLRSDRALPRTIENFSFGSLYLEPEMKNGVEEMRLIYSDFSSWAEPGLLREAQIVQAASLAFYSLLAGRIVETPADQAFTRDLSDAVPESFRDLCNVAFSADPAERRAQRLQAFEQALRDALAEYETTLTAEDYQLTTQQVPLRWFRDWLLHGASQVELTGEYSPSKNPSGRAGEYAIDAEPDRALSFSGLRFQIFPNEETVPREGWLAQHRAALRRPGRRGLPNQLMVQTALKRGRSLLVGEERAEGMSLYDLVREIGPLSIADMEALGGKIAAALDAIDKSAGTAPVWWLPSENVFVVSGTEDPSSLREALGRFGPNAWQRMPVRLRLHLTTPSLLRGIDLPESLLKKVMAPMPGRGMDGARRSTVLLPLIWYALSGHRIDWTGRSNNLSELPRPLRDELENTRRTLIDAPETESGRILEKLHEIGQQIGADTRVGAEVLPEKPSEKADEAFMMAGYTGPINIAALRGQSQTIGAAVGAASVAAAEAATAPPREEEPEEEFIGEAEGVSAPQSLVAEPVEPVETLGVIGEEDFPGEPESPQPEAFEPPAEPDPQIEKSGRDFGAVLRRFGKKTPEETPVEEAAIEEEVPKPSNSGIRQLSDESDFSTPIFPVSAAAEEPAPETEIEFEPELPEEPSAEVEAPETPASEPEDEVQAEPSGPYGTVPLGTISDGEFFEPGENLGYEASETGPRFAKPAAEEPAQSDEGVESLGVIADDGFGDVATPFTEQDAYFQPEQTDGTIVDANYGEPRTNFPVRDGGEVGDTEMDALAKMGGREGSRFDGFGERLLPGEATSEVEEGPKRSLVERLFPKIPIWKVLVTALVLAVVLGAVSVVANLFSGFSKGASWQAFTEQLPVAVYQPKSSEPSMANESSAAETESITTPSNLAEALAEGKNALERQDFHTAIANFVAGLELSPASSEAKLAVGRTVEEWLAVGAPVGAADALLLEKVTPLAPEAKRLLATHYLEADPRKGMTLLEESAESGYPPHLVALGLIYARGDRVPQDLAEAADYFRRAADKGDVDGQFYYGEAFVLGRGIDKNVQLGMDWLKQAAESGDARAMNLLGVCYVQGVEWGVNADFSRASNYFDESLNLGEVAAHANLGLRHAKGGGREKDPVQAVQHFQAGAEAGDPECMVLLAKCLRKGYSLAKNLEAASVYYQQAAIRGNVEANAWCRANGVEVP